MSAGVTAARSAATPRSWAAPPRRLPSDLAARAGLVAATGLITTYLGFASGGYFPDATGLVAVGLAVGLILRVGLAHNPFAGFSRSSGVAVAALALLAMWTLISSSWSHAPGRAILEVNRTLLYLAALVLFGSLVRRRGRLAALAGGVALGSVVVGAAGLLTRALPHVFPVVPPFANYRLSYPESYWNAAGLLAALGILLCLGLSGAERVPRPLRAVISGAIPVLAATLVLSFSRGAIAAALVGLVVLFGLCRTRTLLSALVTSLPGSAFACQAAYAATALATQTPTGPDAVSQGRHLVVVVGFACLGSVALRAVLSHWDDHRLLPAGTSPRTRRLLAVAGALALLAGAGAAGAALHLPHVISGQYHRFIASNQQAGTGQSTVRSRLLDPANDNRLAIWDAAADAGGRELLHGTGAGTFQVVWNVNRPNAENIVNAHSVYLGTVSELGLVGLALLLVCVLGPVVAIAWRAASRRSRKPDRAIAAGLLAAAVCWLVHAGVDWDWEIPAVTWWVFAAGGLALARGRRSRPGLRAPGRLARLLVMLAIAVVAVLPAQVALSQHSLNRAVSAFERGDCNAAAASALKAVSYVSARAEPYEILAYCDARDGYRDLALTMIQNAINRDPKNWEFHYDQAIVRGAVGLDPRRSARIARALNPLNPLAVSLASAVRPNDPRVWRAQALAAPLLVAGYPTLGRVRPRA